MKKKSITIVFILLISQLVFSQDNNQQAPLLKLDIEINGEKHRITDGDSLVLNGNLIKIKTSDFITFDYAALTFDYPKHFAYEYEEDYGYKNWSLDGNDFVIMYFQYDVNIELDMFINQMTEQFGKENCKVSEKNIQLGNLTLKGKRIKVDMVGVKLTYDMYKVEADDSKTHFIAFQDSKNDNGSDSNEYTETLKIIEKTIKLR